MTIINENLAKRAKENMGHSSYNEGSATAEYNERMASVKATAEKAKARCNKEESKKRIDKLVSRYETAYANWTNKYNSNGAGHVSVMISGASNYNMNAHKKYLAREGKLWEEYNELKDIEHKIWAVVTGDKIIKTGDADAIERLTEKIANLEKAQEMMKAANKVCKSKKLTDAEKVEQLVNLGYKKSHANELLQPSHCCSIGFASYSLSNNNANIRTAKQRLEKLQKLAEIAESTPQEERTTDINGIQIIDNIEANRIQIIFEGKPDADIRTELKSNGFRWAPSNGAWQAYRNDRTMNKAKEIVSKIA